MTRAQRTAHRVIWLALAPLLLLLLAFAILARVDAAADPAGRSRGEASP